MASKDALGRVLSHLKEGRILGIANSWNARSSASIWRPDMIKSTALKYRSYNPSLTKDDFSNLEPNVLFNPKRANATEFQLIKCRDPKFFQFKDQYVLLFKDHTSMTKYIQNTSSGRINHVRVKFVPLRVGDMIGINYMNYVHNLLAAYDSSKTYFEMIKRKKDSTADIDLHELAQIAQPFEEKSALVWDLPLEAKPMHVMDRFWFYDIKHCFKLYWDHITGHTLYYVAFNEAQDCTKFRRNLHGCRLNDLPRKLLIDQLKG
ncbi:hypothetical protein ZYGM_000083 [Zygosaccharomyces mellis]|uniref:Uncharacterized protein n=1 Tax=Zygosaccharomyces mellis TaxID=42258 RepID=A0A4C2EBY0_9SACH|nr:hypothetical protein ZYGM_000083 [Zygosaccharomyces mellis]